jgi:hypothetical protein
MHQMLTQLKLARIREIHQDWLDRAAETQMAYPDLLRGLLQEELLAREDNQLRRRLKDASFPFEKTMDDFDFRLRPELNRQVFLRYLDDRFVTRGMRCVSSGPRGSARRTWRSRSAWRCSSAATTYASPPSRPCSRASSAPRGSMAAPRSSSPITPATSSFSTSWATCPPIPTSARSSRGHRHPV